MPSQENMLQSVSREKTQERINIYANAARAPLPSEQWTVIDHMEQLAENQPDRSCLIYQDQVISYAELDAMAGRYASLALDCGLKAGDVAAVMIENRPEFFFAWMGLAKIGVTAALVNTQARNQALEHAIRETRCKLLFLGAECLDQFLETEMCSTGEVRTFVLSDAELVRNFVCEA